MRVLGIESSSLVASVALVTDDILTAEYTVDFKKTHSQTLLPMLDEIVKLLELDMDTIDAIAVAGGPGSFTGLRIGAATAKGLGLALKKPLVHVPTVDAMAYNMWGAEGLICPIMDAKRSQVYTGLYHTGNGLEVVMEQQPMDMMELAGLSFLGLGVKPPMAEWGSMINDGRSMLQISPWMVLAPGMAIFITVMIFNLLGDTIRDYMDPKERNRRKG